MEKRADFLRGNSSTNLSITISHRSRWL